MNKNGFIRFIAWRYFRHSRTGENLISLVSTISIVGVAIGCFALVVSLSVLNGFRSEIVSRNIHFEAGVKSEQFPMNKSMVQDMLNWRKSMAEIRTAIPEIERKAMLTGSENTQVVYIKGLELNGQSYPLESEIIGGEFDLGTAEHPKVVIGFHLRDQIGLGVGDTLAMISPLESSGPFYTPPVVRAEISGVFRAELFQYDQIYAFTNIHAAQELFRLENKYTGVEFFLHDYQKSQEIAEQIRGTEKFRALETTTWYERRSSLYNAMRMEKWGSFVALTLIIVVAIFNLVSSLLMLVLKKIRDIGILKTMGAEDGVIQRIFLRQGWYVGGIGTLVGVVSGVALVLFQEFSGIFKLPGEAYFIDAVPVTLSLIDILLISVISITLSILSSVYPAKQAAKLEPIEAISYEH